jgi:hypothetical protein
VLPLWNISDTLLLVLDFFFDSFPMQAYPGADCRCALRMDLGASSAVDGAFFAGVVDASSSGVGGVPFHSQPKFVYFKSILYNPSSLEGL